MLATLIEQDVRDGALETRRVLERVQPVALRPLLEELAVATQGAAAQRRIRIELDAPVDVVVEGDPFLLRRALIAVRDQGTGIPGYAQDKVFEKFYSLARPHSQKKSTGLGLSFVKEIAALHHGRIELHNRPEDEGPGTAAILALPRAPV